MTSKDWPFGTLQMFGYDIVMIDVPWPWEAYGPGGYGKSPEAQYSTMEWEEIEALPVGELLGAGGVVWCWCTWPLIARQSRVVEEHWALKVITGGAWAKRTRNNKLRWGPGYAIRSVCEPFVIASTGRNDWIRGRSSVNLIETLEDLTLDGLAREHSRKPDEAYELLEALTPSARRADVFSRQTRPRWDAYGREAGKFDEAAA